MSAAGWLRRDRGDVASGNGSANYRSTQRGGFIKKYGYGTPGRRQMPQFHLSDEELDNIVAFLKYTSEINTANWPPNIEG